MDDLQTLRVFLIEIDAGDATIEYLFPELSEIGTAFVPYPGLRKEPAVVVILVDADAEINILSKTHVRESA